MKYDDYEKILFPTITGQIGGSNTGRRTMINCMAQGKRTNEYEMKTQR